MKINLKGEKEISFLIKIFIGMLCMSYIFIRIVFDYYTHYGNVISAIMLLIVSVNFLIKVKENIIFFILAFFILYSNYSIAMGVYFNTQYTEPLNMYNQILDPINRGIALDTILLFMTLLYVFFPNIKNSKIKNNIFEGDENIYIVFIIFIISIYIIIFEFQEPIVAGERGSASTIYEYGSIFFIIGLYYCGKNRKLRNVLMILIIIYVMQDVIYGGRINAIKTMIVIFSFLYSNRVTYKQIILPMVLCVFVSVGLGMFRQNLELSMEALEAVYISLKENALVFDTAVWAFFPTLTFIEMKSILPLNERLQLFGNFLKSIILGSKSVPNSVLPYYTRQFYEHYNGGYIPGYFYFWFGWAGVIVIAIILILLFNKLNNIYSDNLNSKNINGYPKLLFIFIVSTVPRWYMYDPSNIFRGTLLFSIVYVAFLIVDTFTKSNTKQKLK